MAYYQFADYDHDGHWEFFGRFGTDIREYDEVNQTWIDHDILDGATTFQIVDVNGDGALDFVGVYGTELRILDAAFAATGAGNDTLVGTDLNDLIEGLTGNDTMTGGLGDDVFVMSTLFGNDVITDFTTGDVLRFTGIVGLAAPADVMAHASIVGSDTVIDIAGEGTLTLENYAGLTDTMIFIA